jgi:protein-tyrosine phosphatase
LLSILVVCTANICRSPLGAAILARKLPAGSARVTSAGVRALSGNRADPVIVQLAAEHGYGDLTGHRSQPLLAGTLNSIDLVLCMESAHRDRLLKSSPTMTGRIRLFVDQPPADVADPVGRLPEEYLACLKVLEAAAEAWPARLAQVGLLPAGALSREPRP